MSGSSKLHQVTRNIATTSVAEFQRQELKFMVSNNLIDVLIPELSTFLDHDKFSNDGFYDIFSVYFDTEDWQAFYAKIDGLRHRQKFRIRSYYSNPKPDDNVFLEIKEKINQTVMKRRTPVTLKSAREMLEGKFLDNENPVYYEWRRALIRNAIKPKLLNNYHRLAFESDRFPGLRVTIDKNIAYTFSPYIEFNTPTRNVTWSQNCSVVEIKFDRYVPRFIVDIIRRYNMTMQPVSKYCDSVIAQYLLL